MPTAVATSSRRLSGICGRRPRIDPGAPRPRELLGDVNYAAAPLSAGRRPLSGVRRPRRSIAARALQAGAGALPGRTAHARHRGAAEGGRHRRGVRGSPLPDGPLPARRAASRAGARRPCRRAIALAPALLQAREELADLYGRLGRTEEWITQLEALRALDPSPARDVTLGLAYSKAGQSDRAVDHASPRRRATSDASAHLRRARPGVAGDGAGPVGSRRIEQGARGAREGGRARKDTSEAYMLFGRALLLASDAEPRRTHAAAGHARSCRPIRWRSTTSPTPPSAAPISTSRARRSSTTSRSRERTPTCAAVPRSPSASPICRCASSDFPVAATWYERAAPTLAGDEARPRQARQRALARRSDRCRASPSSTRCSRRIRQNVPR